MFNIAILKLKDVIKFAIVIVVAIFTIMFCAKNLKSIQTNKTNNEKEQALQKNDDRFIFFSKNSLSKILDQTLPAIKNMNEEYRNIAKEEDPASDKNILKSMMKTQISSVKGLEEIESKQKEKDTNNNIDSSENVNNNQNEANNTKKANNIESSEIKVAETGVTTQVITQNPIAEKSNVQYGNVKIKNETDYELTQEMLKPDITIENKNIIIFHTHSCESYTSSEKYPYTTTGNYRTTDLNYTVTRVGTELENQLKNYNFNVVHNQDYHDYPSYNGSYTRSLKTVEGILETTPSDIIIDLHRDAVGSRSDYAPTVKIGDEEAAQIMFVIGTNNGGLWHPNWNQNLKFAVKVQEKAEELYPGLFKPIMLTKSRYNQHTGKYANIIEVGATGNTLEQCLNSMKYLAKIMNDIT